MTQKRIGTVLFDKQKSSLKDIDMGLLLQKTSSHPCLLGEVLVQYKLAKEIDIVQGLSEQIGWPVFEGEWMVDETLVEDFGWEFFQNHHIFPSQYQGQKAVIFSDGEKMDAVDVLRSEYGEHIAFFIADKKLLDQQLWSRRLVTPVAEQPQNSIADIADDLLEKAIDRRASDLHFESSALGVEVRFRIDGVLHFHTAFSMNDWGRLLNVFFHRAELNAGDFLKFHDACFSYVYQGRRIDIRLSHIPTVYGSSLVLRLLDMDKALMDLTALGFTEKQLLLFKKILTTPHGLLLVTGPTGCGKTTTLYAMLDEMRGVQTKIITIEDPVEIRMPLVTQVEIDLKKEHDFSHAMRSALRHDPDVILIGEIRDEITSQSALRAAMTGHRVLSTLHTNDALGAIFRLKDLGVDMTQMAHVLVGVVAQRLVRRLCEHCKKKIFIDECVFTPEEQKYITEDMEFIYQSTGCQFCVGGFQGRKVISEILLITDQMRFLIEQSLFQEVACLYKSHESKNSLAEDAKRLLSLGETSLGEIIRVLG